MIKRTDAPTEKNIGELWWVDHVPSVIQRLNYTLYYLPVGEVESIQLSNAMVFHGPVERPEFE